MTEKFDVILADPPWDYYGSSTKMAAAGKHYPLMSDQALLDLPIVKDSLARPGVLFMWATSPRLDFALQLIEHWGLTYRGTAFVWVKTRKDGLPIGAQGVRPSITKPTTEFVLAASNMTRGRPLPLASEKIAQVVLAPRREHSRKPEEVAQRIEEMYPQTRKLEVFARQTRPGWVAWGNETNKFDQDVAG